MSSVWFLVTGAKNCTSLKAAKFIALAELQICQVYSCFTGIFPFIHGDGGEWVPITRVGPIENFVTRIAEVWRERNAEWTARWFQMVGMLFL